MGAKSELWSRAPMGAKTAVEQSTHGYLDRAETSAAKVEDGRKKTIPEGLNSEDSEFQHNVMKCLETVNMTTTGTYLHPPKSLGENLRDCVIKSSLNVKHVLTMN